ncbi:hypothetical protein DFJ74DRAFT_693511 [Hyaloraphidium curvatum]|nr:hypothetical protein DFJ74DRAFT_693511 [Hyaloraphidium curvatum]
MLAATAASFASIATHTPSDHLDPAAFLSAGSALLLPQLAPLLAALETPLQQSLLDAATSFAVACARTALPGERDAWLSALARAAVPEDKPAASAPPPPVEKGGTLMSTLTSLASFASAPARPLPVGPDRGAACLAALVSAAGSLSEETDMEPAAWEPLLSAIWKAETRGRSPGWPDVAKWPTGGARHLLRGIAGWTDAQASKSAWDAAAWGVARAKDCILARADVLPSDAEGWESAMAPIVKTAWAEGAGQARQVACAAFGECFAAAVEKGDMADPAAEGRVLKSLKDFVGVGANGRSAAWAVDVTKAGMDALDKVLQRSGERFSRGWEAVLEVVGGVVGSSGAARKAPGKVEVDARYLAVAGTEEAAGSALMTGAGGPAASRAQAMVRAAFPVVRLICNDFLPLLDPGCLGACVDALACFGAQGDDLNVTLSAVGLAWTVSDHIMTLRTATAAEGATADAEKLDTLWNNLLEQLADLCTDPRPEVRHAANQTLFRTVTLQGGKLTEEVWDNVLWNVLFPLLERVRIVGDKVAQAADRAAVDKVGQEGAPRLASSGFVLHHSRNTVAKQWDETRALTLTGVGKCFREHMAAFVSIGAGRFDKAWALFFEYVKDWCLGYSQEVSLASMKTLATVLGYPQDTDVPEDVREKLEPYWMTAWGEWTTIGEGIVIRANGDLPDRRSTDHDGRSGSEEVSKPAEDDDGPDGAARESFDHVFEKAEDGLPREISGEFTQETIAAYASAFLDLYPTVQPQFKDGDFTRLMRLLNQLLVYVTAVEPGSKYAKAVWDLDVLSPLQDVVLKILSALETTRPTLYLAILGELASHVKLPIRRGFASPTRAHASAKAQSKGAPQGPTFVTFSAQAMEMAWDIVDRHRTLPALYADDVLPDLLLAHGDLMKYKYDCPSAGSKPTDVPLWKAAASAFLRLLRCLLPSMRSLEGQISPATVSVVYEAALDTFDAFLLSPSNPGPDATETQLAADEDFDISVLREIENDLVPYLGMPGMPESLALQLVDTLRKGSNLYLGVDSAHGAAVPSSPARAVNGVHAKAAQGGSKAGPNVNKVRVVNIPVHRERFANECLDLMFGLCSDNREDNVEERRRVAEIVAPALLERCSTVISNYVVAKGQGKQQHHRAPTGLGQTIAPQDDYQELVRVLGKLVELKLRPKVLKIPESSNPVKNLILSGPSAHLFFLYLPICECLSSADGHASEDRDVEELVKRALKRMGMEMGLV